MADELLNASDLKEALENLPEWQLDEDKTGIQREFTFADFSQAFAFMTRVAMLAEKHDHHPEWQNSWDWVFIRLTTDDLGGVTEQDVDLALAIDELLD
ncbi:4a-hydroxytetrahydrobiopterin dehydratase [Novosphingobium umbonatum]|uniref:Putative pterin-4-alpha-carbinolamine dehydratase n=1 Tax=Novosphingobium umbonatum TaxID=1908524 RepID=A0A3S2VA82_9SPHN|nr:4a-hydroxytetrahydrobiopterin dehydratase [Novosphingobium umbonatum]RVU07623.1 4a-hydroxytetrahydrobiopterin dehydratase [Novosphingobium umbonatum]